MKIEQAVPDAQIFQRPQAQRVYVGTGTGAYIKVVPAKVSTFTSDGEVRRCIAALETYYHLPKPYFPLCVAAGSSVPVRWTVLISTNLEFENPNRSVPAGNTVRARKPIDGASCGRRQSVRLPETRYKLVSRISCPWLVNFMERIQILQLVPDFRHQWLRYF